MKYFLIVEFSTLMFSTPLSIGIEPYLFVPSYIIFYKITNFCDCDST